MANNFVVELVSLNLLIFRFIITYFRTLRMRQIAPFFYNILSGEHAPGPPSTSVNSPSFSPTYALAM